MFVALVDLGSLREAGTLLVHRLRREQPRHFRAQLFQAHRAVVLEQRMKGVVADPCLIPEHILAKMTDLFEHLADVVDRAVIGRELDTGEPKGALGLVPPRVRYERVRPNLLAQIILVPGSPVDRTDHPERVARRWEENGY